MNIEFFQEFWQNQPTTVIGAGVAISVLLGIYIFLLKSYK
jgi:preprotein translocase subunit Sec61beta